MTNAVLPHIRAQRHGRIINALHRVAPARIFDRIIRRFNGMPN